MNKWKITDELIAKFAPLLRDQIAAWDSLSDEQVDKIYEEGSQSMLVMDLTGMDISPYQLKKLLELELGYEYQDMDENGWEMDFWIHMRRRQGAPRRSALGDNLVICGCGMAFTLSIEPYGLK